MSSRVTEVVTTASVGPGPGTGSGRLGSSSESAASQSSPRLMGVVAETTDIVGVGGGGGGGGGDLGSGGVGGVTQVMDLSVTGPRNRNHRTTTEATGASEVVDHGPDQRPGSKACCFCWCCCCSCSRKRFDPNNTKRINEENNARNRDRNKLEIINGDNDAVPTLEDIRAWGESFDKLMKSSAGRRVFRDFLKCEYSEENILFWLACEDIKKESKAEAIGEKARLIYEDYISILSPKEVSLDSRVREMINRNMVNPTPHTFDEAQLQIYTLMHRDSYPRFVNSPLYKKMAQLNSSSRKESTA